MNRRLSVMVLAASVLAAACSSAGSTASTVRPAGTSAPIAAPATGVPATGVPATTPSIPATSTTSPAAPATTTAAGFPVRVAYGAGVTDIPSRPSRIAALSATHVEMLFAMGAGPQVVAGDHYSNYPPGDVDRLQLVDSFNLNVEAVVDLAPDLVVLSFDPGGAADALRAVGIPVLVLGTALSLDDVYEQTLALGTATGHRDEARALVAGMRDDIAEIVTSARPDASGISFYHESDPFSFYTPNSSSFIGSLYGLLGMINIADEAPDEFNSGFPQLSAEFIVASDPDVIYLAGFGETLETVAARDGWDTMTAVQSGRVVVLDSDVASRWGPRVVELLRAIAGGVALVRGG